MLVGGKVTEDADVALICGRFRFPDRLCGKIVDRLNLQYFFYPSSFLLPYRKWFCEADIIQVFNTHGSYFSHLAFKKISKSRPIVWRLSDMWAFTGHCAYAYDCQRWQIGCGFCPRLFEYPALRIDTSAFLWRIKRRIYENSRPTIVAPSRWIANLVKQSPLLKRFSMHIIPNGLDIELFRPTPKLQARLALGITPENRTILFSAASIKLSRKGLTFLIEAMQRLNSQGLKSFELLVVGENTEKLELDIPYHINVLGPIRDDAKMATVYSAADIFVLPTLAENLPNGVIESMACGTPVVCFDVGGVSDAVRHMQTGYLATYRDAEDLAKGIKLLLENNVLREKMGQSCRQVVELKYSLRLQASRFKQLYKDLLGQRKAGLGGIDFEVKNNEEEKDLVPGNSFSSPFLVVSSTFPPHPGGSSQVLRNLLHWFNPADFIVATSNISQNEFHSEQIDNIYIFHLSTFFSVWRRYAQIRNTIQIPKAVNRAVRLMRKYRCCAIIGIFPDIQYLTISYITHLLTGVPLIVYMHDLLVENKYGGYLGLLSRWVQSRIFKSAKLVWVLHSGMADYIKKNYGVNVEILPHCYNEPLSETMPDTAVCKGDSSNLCLCFSGVVGEINAKALSRIIGCVGNIPNARVTLTGHNNPRSLKRYGIANSNLITRFFLDHSELLKFLRAQDVLFSCLSWPHESWVGEYELATIFPTKIPEYLAQGKPILIHCPENYFLAKFIKKYDCGWVVTERSEKAILSALDEIKSNEKRRQIRCENALNTARMFSGERIAEQFREGILRSINAGEIGTR